MKRFKKILPYIMVLFVVGIFTEFNLPAGTAATDSRTFMIPANFSEIAEKVGPAVVNIRTEKTTKSGGRVFRHFGPGPFDREDPFQDFFNKFFGGDQQREFKQRSLGSGFIIEKAGFIVTNNHVIENADKVKVKLKNGDEFDAEVVGRDPNTDLALIKIDAKGDLPTVKIGDSDSIRVGQWVVAIGSPFGFEQTVTSGIVSAKGRVIGSGPYDDFIQTDASINPGNSGGPLINLQGEVVGINTAIIASGQGIGFAIPINMAKGIVDQLKSSGEVTRGWLGVAIQPLSSELGAYYGIKDGKGVLVTEVFKGDPAEQAGIRPQDVILEVNGKQIEDSRDLTRTIANLPVGETVAIKLMREGKEQQVKVKLSKREDAKIAGRQQPQRSGDELGIQVAEITTEMMQRYNLPKVEGVIVVETDSQGKGAEAGIQMGDIVVEINYKKIKTVKDYNEQLQKIKKGEKIKMLVQRPNAGFLVIEIEK